MYFRAMVATSSSRAPNGFLARSNSIEDVQELKDSGNLGIEIDVMIGQLTLRSRHLAALETDIPNHPDAKCIFGEKYPQIRFYNWKPSLFCYEKGRCRTVIF